MTFGKALESIQQEDIRVARSGWNGKGMFVFIGHFPSCDEIESGKILPCLVMKTAQGDFQPGWLASQADMLASDWEAV